MNMNDEAKYNQRRAHEADKAEQRQMVLEWVNKVRLEYGMEPLTELPRGYRSKASSCPIARGLSNGWKAETSGGTTVMTKKRLFRRKEEKIVEHPNFVFRFVFDFDAGRYPELVARSSDA